MARMSSNDITKILTTGIKVYSCARMMGLDELAKTSLNLFFEKDQHFIKSDLSEVLKSCFEILEPDDEVFRQRLLDRCIENNKVLEKLPKVIEVLKEHEPALWRFAPRKYNIAEIYHEMWEAEVDKYTKANNDADFFQKRNMQHYIELQQVGLKIAELEMDIADLKYGWERMPMTCGKCNRDLSGTRWIKTRFNGRLQYMCKCGSKYSSGLEVV